MCRKRIKNKQIRILYFPIAFIQWIFYTLLFSGLGLTILTPLSIMLLIGSLFMLDKKTCKDNIDMALMPIILPFKWWYDYITNGEIGMYE